MKRSHHKEKKKPRMPISVTQPQCVSTFFFSPCVFSESHPSDFSLLALLFLPFFMIHLFWLHVCRTLSSKGGSTGLCAQLFLSFLSSLRVCSASERMFTSSNRSEPRPSKCGRPSEWTQNFQYLLWKKETERAMSTVMDGRCSLQIIF